VLSSNSNPQKPHKKRRSLTLKLKDLFTYRPKTHAVQTARQRAHPYESWMGYTPLSAPDTALYAAMREAVPVIDAAIDKIVRLTGNFRVICSDQRRQAELDRFLGGVRTGASGWGLRPFVNAYLDSLLTYGNAVGEIIPAAGGDDIAALYHARLSDVHIRPGKTPLEAEICAAAATGRPQPVKYPGLVLFTALNPPAGEIRGVSLLRSLPFVADVLMKIFSSVGTNFERIANLRYAVTYNPGGSGVDKAYAKEIAATIAEQWTDSVQSAKSGVIKDFIAVGDVGIKVIGADNQMLDTEIPVRQMLEQIVAKLGVPPFLLGLHWSSTERMSAQQADILTSELESYRKLLDSVILRICAMWLRLKGYGAVCRTEWEAINLQDQVETANARLLLARAMQLEGQQKGEAHEAEPLYH
jgi:hypothetical protein